MLLGAHSIVAGRKLKSHKSYALRWETLPIRHRMCCRFRQMPQEKVPVHPVDSRLYLQCPISDKDEAKKLGAKWDPGKREWYVIPKKTRGVHIGGVLG